MTQKLPPSQWVKDENAFWLSNLVNRIPLILYCLIVVSLPFQVGKHFWPQWAFVLGQRIDYLSPTLYLTDIFVACLFVITIVRQRIPMRVAYIVAIGVLAASSALSSDSSVGWYWLVRFFECSFVCWYTATQKLPTQKILSALLGIGIVFESLLAFSQYFLQGSVGGILYFFGERSFSAMTPGIANVSLNHQLLLRPYGTFPHPNVLGGYLLLSLMLFLGLMGRNNKTTIKVLYGTILLIGVVGLSLTLSRSAIFAGLLSLVLYLFLKIFEKSIQKKVLVLILGGAVCMGLLFLIFFPPLFFRLSTFPIDQSIVEREKLFGASLQMIAKSPVFGVGPNNFIPTLPSVGEDLLLQPVHNALLLWVSETGIVGLCVAVIFLFEIAKKTWNFLKSAHKKNNALFMAVVCCMVSIGIISLFDHYFLSLQQGQLLLAFVIGLFYRVSMIQ